mmetsp:Transcript_14513/g.38829  ORF Transcript_14513/g.38829 Transcript_14513/m.38829 type:complete len:246 (+) Transcript_14513:405-1142(+)
MLSLRSSSIEPSPEYKDDPSATFNSMSPSASSTREACIALLVSVPVLSVHKICAQPSVSTLGRWRTMAPFLAMRSAPSAKQVVTTAGRPSGTAATASATAVSKLVIALSQPLRLVFRPQIKTHSTNTIWPSCTPSSSSWRCIGVCSSLPRSNTSSIILRARTCTFSSTASMPLAPERDARMRPSTEALPVAVAIAEHRPLSTVLPANTMFSRSCKAVPVCRASVGCRVMELAHFETGSLSPVRKL